MTTFHRLGEVFLQRRKALRRTQAQIAREAGLRQEEVSRLENARLPNFTVAKLLKLARALNLEVTIRPRETAKSTPGTVLVEYRSGANAGQVEP